MESAFPKSTCQYFVLSISHIPISIGCFSFFFFMYLTSAPPLNQLWELGSQPLCWCCHWFMRFSVPAKNLQFSLDLPPVSEPWTQSTWRKKENECYFKYRKKFAKSTSRVAKSTKAPLVASVHILRACLLEGGGGNQKKEQVTLEGKTVQSANLLGFIPVAWVCSQYPLQLVTLF